MPTIEQLLSRPPEQRLREYKYRCAQSIIFGLPVIVLHYLGHRLGGPESARWVFILQAILTGWVMYVGAAGMFFEGAIRIRKGISPDLIAAAVAIALYLISLVAMRPMLFPFSVLIVATWTAMQWIRLAKSAAWHPNLKKS